MEVFIREKEKEKYEDFSLMGYYHTNRKGEENTNLKACLVQDIWVSDDDEDLPKLTLKSLEQHDAEVKKQVVEELREWLVEDRYNFNMITIRDLKQKLTELEKTPQGKGEKDE